MIESRIPEIDVEIIMARIKEEVERHHRLASTRANKGFSAPTDRFRSGRDTSFIPCPPIAMRPLASTPQPLPIKDFYRLSDFLSCHAEDFIDKAYAGLLHRGPDANGRSHFLNQLRSGALTKIEILGRLRYSREGREKKVAVKGLLLPFILQTLFKVPVLGWGLRIVSGLLNLPTILKNIQVIENNLLTRMMQDRKEAEETLSTLCLLRNHVAALQNEIALRLNSKMEKSDMLALESEWMNKLNALDGKIIDLLGKPIHSEAACNETGKALVTGGASEPPLSRGVDSWRSNS